MKTNTFRALFAALIAVGTGTAAAHADTLSLTLNPSTEAASSGGTAVFSATASAPLGNGAPVFLNGDTVTFSGPQDILFDDSDLFNFPVSLAPGESFTNPLFTAAIPASEAPGTYTGFYTLEGGGDGNAQGVLATDPFTLTVAATPEPSSYVLSVSGAVGLLVLAYRRRIASGLSS